MPSDRRAGPLANSVAAYESARSELASAMDAHLAEANAVLARWEQKDLESLFVNTAFSPRVRAVAARVYLRRAMVGSKGLLRAIAEDQMRRLEVSSNTALVHELEDFTQHYSWFGRITNSSPTFS